MLRPRPHLLVAASLWAPACILPAGAATGVELTWTLREANDVDGPDARRLRTCHGADLPRMSVQVVDDADPARDRRFGYQCEAGNAAPEDRAVDPPEIFLDLRAGNYTFTASGRDAEAVAAAEVHHHAITALDLELVRPPQTLDLELVGACIQLLATLRYADPVADLYLDAPDAPPVVYRHALASDRGLRLGGQAQPCAGLAGPHRVLAVDPGRYLLDLDIDGHRCSVPLTVEDSPVQRTLDLENPACDG